MIRFVKRAAKAVAGFVVTVLSLPIVETVITNAPLSFDWKYAIGGIVVGAAVYAVPNEKETE